MEAVNKTKLLQLFNKLSKPEQLAVFEQISTQTFAQRWNLADSELPDTNLTEEEIIEEIRAVRYGKESPDST